MAGPAGWSGAERPAVGGPLRVDEHASGVLPYPPPR
ncbi:hypothetical protein JOF53_007542 [Crossiella equi]|uniref:Uncharacterized protein n=1 Tax=Crossiella equi TaxID=130796 RepID=A0ABS5AQ45_9PSEU|nr:hypothetical protein [Crossiella equi]